MDRIEINDIRLYACHGCLKEESIIGSDYSIDLAVLADLTQASVSDNLSDTVDYVHLHSIVKEEMDIPSKLLEHVGSRIIGRIFTELAQVKEVCVAIGKINPPIGGDVALVKVIMQKKRE